MCTGAESQRVELRPRCFETGAAEATEALGEALGALLPAGTCVALVGELGSGKTCLIRGLARGLGVEEPVSSPSYTLMHEYEGRLPVYHFDAWMEGREKAFLAGGGADWLASEGVSLVEWADRVEDWIPLPCLRVALRHAGPERRALRLVVVAPVGKSGEASEAIEVLEGAMRALEAPPGVTEVPADAG